METIRLITFFGHSKWFEGAVDEATIKCNDWLAKNSKKYKIRQVLKSHSTREERAGFGGVRVFDNHHAITVVYEAD